MGFLKEIFNPDYRKCQKCGALLNNNVHQCPNCGWNPLALVQFGVIAALIIIAVGANVYLKISSVQLRENFKRHNTSPLESLEGSQGESIRVKPMIPLSGMDASAILRLRKDAVSRTIAFGDVSKYEPSEKVFYIEDGLPWIGAHEGSCMGTDNNEKIGEGESRESLPIINPELLYHFIIPSYNDDPSLCSPADYMVPRRLIYHKEKNTLVAYIDFQTLVEKRGHNLLYAADANARDFGYNFAYADKYHNIQFDSENNFSKQITQTMGFWHRGYACGLKDGCNNYSPRNDMIYFRTTALPAGINIKLWKKEPSSPKQKADMNYMIVFE